jgi:hypothetical protein
MPRTDYRWIVTSPEGRRIVVSGRTSRCLCPECGWVFSGEDSFDRHRVGSFESDEHRRCLAPEEWAATGLHVKASGVVGRFARKADATGNGAIKSVVRVEGDAELPDEDQHAPGSGIAPEQPLIGVTGPIRGRSLAARKASFK